ncbi:DUF732 domain-containing protein [Terrabacter sp. NPDC080008]|uniref:DUF732 domain-containing protein n=1 Tax=Terrabacter sp. NPDC080008 TaxID=3155176 RepID=UPI00344FD26C
MAGLRAFLRAGGLVGLFCLVACSGPAATTTSPAPSPSTSSTSAQPPSGATAQARYLAEARIDLKHPDRAAMIATAQSICATIRSGSRDDAVGDLAARIGDQPAAYRLVSLAADAYCPQPPH